MKIKYKKAEMMMKYWRHVKGVAYIGVPDGSGQRFVTLTDNFSMAATESTFATQNGRLFIRVTYCGRSTTR